MPRTERCRIAAVRSATPGEWDAIWTGCDHATYFHSRDWAEIWQTYTEGAVRPDPRVIEFSDGMSALLPLSVDHRGAAPRHLSSPAGCFGGWLSRDTLDERHAALIVGFLTCELGPLAWRVNPHHEQQVRAAPACEDAVHTRALRLAPGYEEIVKSWSKGHRAAVGQARRAGVSIATAEAPHEWKLYYEVYEESLKRWGDGASSRYEWPLFEAIRERSPSHATLWLARHRGEIAAGALVFYAGTHAVYWHGAAREEDFQARPVNLLLAEAIEDACRRGYEIFDFNPSGGHESVDAFKRRFGSEALPAPMIRVEPRSWARGLAARVGRLWR